MDDPLNSPEHRREPWQVSILDNFYKIINRDHCQAQSLQIALAELLERTLSTQQLSGATAKELIEFWSSDDYTFDIRSGSDDNSPLALLERPTEKEIDSERKNANARRARLITEVMAYLGTSEHVVLTAEQRTRVFSYALTNIKRNVGHKNSEAVEMVGGAARAQLDFAMMNGGGEHIPDVVLAMTQAGLLDRVTAEKYVVSEPRGDDI